LPPHACAMSKVRRAVHQHTGIPARPVLSRGARR
jgi:hypothetical protein